MLGLGRGKNLIGLDIGSSSIKIAEVKDTKRGFHLENFGVQTLPPEVIVDGAVMNTSAVVDAVQELLRSRKIKTKNVCTSVSGHAVIIRKIKVPAASEEELAQSIQWDAAQYVPFDINEVNLSYEIVNPADEEGNMEVLMVAAKKDLVNDYVAVLKEATLNPVIMDVDSFALCNMYEVNYPIQEGEVVALINIGAAVINISVLRGGQVLFTRDVSAGGKQITEEIQRQLGVSYEEAEMLKIGGSGSGDTEEVMRQEVQDVIRNVSDSLGTEIQRSLDFFTATSAEDNISKIWLAGGTAKVSGLKEITEERTGIPCEMLNPFAGLSYDEKKFDVAYLEEMAPLAAVAVGLAIRRVGDK